ncbi:MAG: ABC transporter permease [Acidimicrobiales bacterium]
MTGAEPFAARQYVGLLLRWTRRDLESRYRRSAISIAWAIVAPLLQVALYVFVFGVIFDQSGGDVPYLSYVLAGMVVYRIVTAGLGVNRCFTDQRDLLGHLAFPRELLPMVQVLVAVVDLLVLVPTLLVVAVVQGVELSAWVLLAPVVLLGALVLAVGLGIFASTVQVFVGDIAFVIGFVTQLLFFASPISYPPDRIPEQLGWLLRVNPISVFGEALRSVVLRASAPSWPLLGAHLVLAVLVLVGAVAHLRAVGHRIVDLG